DALNVERTALLRTRASRELWRSARGQLDQAASQGVVGLMPGAMRHDHALDVKPHQSQIAEQVEHLVPRTFVREAKRVSDWSLTTEDQEISRSRAQTDARSTQCVCLPFGDKRAAGGNFSLERLRRHSHAETVRRNRGVRSVIEMVSQREPARGSRV